MPEQLPRNPPPFPLDTIPCEAYNRCLDFESRASDSESMSQLSPLVCARILGYMLIHAPLDTGRVWLSEEIIKCGGDAELKQLGEFYFDHFICVFKSAEPSLYSYELTFESEEVLEQILKGLPLQVTPKDQGTAKAQALVRDNYRCLITRSFDMYIYLKHPEIVARAASCGIIVRPTYATHIFPASTIRWITGDDVEDAKTDYATSVSTVMDCFAGVKVTNELNGPNIHRLENVITLDVGVHGLFDNFFIWLEETDTPHMYRICGNPGLVEILGPTVTFSTTSGLPLPDSRYLRVRAACAKVANLSGADVIISTIVMDMEDGGDTC